MADHRQLHRCRPVRKQAQAVAGGMAGQVDQQVNPVTAHQRCRRRVVHGREVAPERGLAAQAFGHRIGTVDVRVAADLEAVVREPVEQRLEEQRDRMLTEIGRDEADAQTLRTGSIASGRRWRGHRPRLYPRPCAPLPRVLLPISRRWRHRRREPPAILDVRREGFLPSGRRRVVEREQQVAVGRLVHRLIRQHRAVSGQRGLKPAGHPLQVGQVVPGLGHQPPGRRYLPGRRIVAGRRAGVQRGFEGRLGTVVVAPGHAHVAEVDPRGQVRRVGGNGPAVTLDRRRIVAERPLGVAEVVQHLGLVAAGGERIEVGLPRRRQVAGDMAGIAEDGQRRGIAGGQRHRTPGAFHRPAAVAQRASDDVCA